MHFLEAPGAPLRVSAQVAAGGTQVVAVAASQNRVYEWQSENWCAQPMPSSRARPPDAAQPVG